MRNKSKFIKGVICIITMSLLFLGKQPAVAGNSTEIDLLNLTETPCNVTPTSSAISIENVDVLDESLKNTSKFIKVKTRKPTVDKKKKKKLDKLKKKKERQKMLNSGKKKKVPKGYGKVHSFMAWKCITAEDTYQFKVKSLLEHYNSEGVGQVGSRYAVAVKPYYGNIGDDITVIQEDGTEYDCVIVEHKADENNNKYVHYDDSVIEFVVAESWNWKDKHINDIYPQFNKNIKCIINTGKNINLK